MFAGSFLIDGISKTVAALKARAAGTTWGWTLFTALVNVGLSLVLVSRWPISGLAVVAILVGIRMLAAGGPMVLGREKEPGVLTGTPTVGLHPDPRLNLPPDPEFTKLEASQKIEEEGRRSIDIYWCWIFVVLFFAIHIGRMSVDWNLVGMVAPMVAVLGDVITALAIAFGIILPFRLAGRKLTRPLERRLWHRELAWADHGRVSGLARRLYRGWLMYRLRFARRMAQVRRSPSAALPLRWEEMQTFGAVMPVGKTGDDFVEFLITMPARQP